MTRDAHREIFLRADDSTGPARYLVVSYLDPDDASQHHVPVAVGDSLHGALSSFGAKVATLCEEEPEQVAEWLLSGEDHGMWYCPDPASRQFLGGIADAGLRIAAFYLCEGGTPVELVTSLQGAYSEGLLAKFPDCEVLFGWEAAPPHQDEAFWALRRAAAE
jgi:hypothetical protein